MRPAPIIVCVLSLLIAAWVIAQMRATDVPVDEAPSGGPALNAGPQPIASFKETAHDFGEMYHGEKGSHVFTITNTGEGPLNLEVGSSSCSCTIGELARSGLAPGESTEIELKWTIKIPAPRFEHSAEIKTNDPNSRIVTLSIQGRVISGLTTFPPEGARLGFIPYGQSGNTIASVVSDTADEFEIISHEATHPWIDVETLVMNSDQIREADMQMGSEPPEIAGDAAGQKPGVKSGYIVNVSATPSGERGPFSGTVVFKTNLEKHPTIELPYSGTYPGPLEFVALPGTTYLPDQMVIGGGRFKASDGKKCELLMFLRGFDEELEIGEVTSSPKWVKAALTPEPIKGGAGQAQRFRLKIEVPANLPVVTRDRSNPAEILVKTNHPEFQQLKLQFAFISL